LRPPTPISAKERRLLEKLLHRTKDKSNYRRIQCVWLRAAIGLSPQAIARALGLSVNTVRIVQSRYLRHGAEALVGPGRGGRRRQNLSVKQEETLLGAFVERAREGGILVVSELKTVYESEVGRRVPKSTVYRLLARHGWRKVAPRPRHPQVDAEAQRRFKKNSRRS
jgi:transposase